MGRAPCCEKMGLKKGPWTREEDRILINYITLHGHGNWRALPKLAGLLRCGKSCRLRWTNYLRPDIKRGNFTREEEDTIIDLHSAMGNRWSAIAARLPGRTDNEIKNVWHTHLKKRLAASTPEQNPTANPNPEPAQQREDDAEKSRSEENSRGPMESCNGLNSPQHSSSELSSITTSDTNKQDSCKKPETTVVDCFPEPDDDFWGEVLSVEITGESGTFPAIQYGTEFEGAGGDSGFGHNSNFNDRMEFWYNVFTNAGGELMELPEF